MNIIFSIPTRYSLSLMLAASVTGVALSSSTTNFAYAQAADTLSTEGIVGDVDSGRRAPVLTYSTEVAADGSSATILADTQIINDEFKKYPISVDFFVNGKLFSKQIRSLELPAPLGIVVPKEMASIPFNYSIVATTLHPNRQYTTIAQGSVTGSHSDAAFQCTATQSASDGTESLVINGAAPNTLGTDNSLKFTLTQDSSSAEVSLKFAEATTTAPQQVSGTVIVTTDSPSVDDGSASEANVVSYEVSGESETTGTKVTLINVTSSDGVFTLDCESKATTAAATSTVEDDSAESSDLESSNLAGVLNAPTGSNASSGTVDGVGPHGEPNFIPLDKVGGVEVVN